MLDVMLLVIALLFVLYYFVKRNSKKFNLSNADAIFITGCDTGIGYSLACYCQELGMTVFAGCLKLGDGVFQLEELKNVHVVPLDVTDSKSIKSAVVRINHTLTQNEGMVLKVIVNNAGIMVFGEFAWQTESLIQQQININLIGAMNVTKAFLPQLIENQGNLKSCRIINICSHCSLESLPGLSVYGASKAGLLAWNDALRVELQKFSIRAISIIPGSYPLETSILANQKNYAEEMERSMQKQQRHLFKSYFMEYNSYLTGLSQHKKLNRIPDKRLYFMFDDALRLVQPKAHYCHSTWRYWWYHTLFKITPTSLRDKLVLKFINMPSWKEI